LFLAALSRIGFNKNKSRPVNIYLFLAALSRIGFNKKEDKMKVNWKDHIVSTPDVIRGKPRIKVCNAGR
jgi:hypothetical protein